MLFFKPDLFVIVDELEPRDGKAHTYETLFHLDAPSVDVEGLRVATQGAGPSLTVAGFGADAVKIVKGQTEPTVQGWLPDHAAGYGGVKPIPTAIYAKASAGPVTLCYALYASPGAATCPVTDIKATTETLTVRMADGTRREAKLTRASEWTAVAAH